MQRTATDARGRLSNTPMLEHIVLPGKCHRPAQENSRLYDEIVPHRKDIVAKVVDVIGLADRS